MTGRQRWITIVLALLVGFNFAVILWPHGSEDFVTFFLAGRALAAGRNPYGTYLDLTPESHGVVLTPNLNPPVSLFVFQHLTGPATTSLFYLWVALSAVLIAGCLVLMSRAYKKPLSLAALLWVLALGGWGHALFLGQVYAPLALCACGAWVLLDRRRFVWAGVLIGLIVALKPNLILWPIILLLVGAPVAGITAGVVAGILSLLALLSFGPGTYLQWLAASAQTTPLVSQRALSLSLTAVSTRLGAPALGLVLSLAVVAGLLWWARRRKPDLHAASGAAIAAAIIAAPVAWPGYTLLLLPAFLTRLSNSRLWQAAGVGLVTPFAIVDMVTSRLPWLGYGLGSIYTLAVLAVIVAEVKPDRWIHPTLGVRGQPAGQGSPL